MTALIRRLLQWRAVRAGRLVARRLGWTVRGAFIRNPPLPPDVRAVLFVCKGNICRSPFAEHIARRLAGEIGLTRPRFLSAGITANQAASCPVEAVEVARLFEVSLNGHVPTRLSQALVDEADLVVVMEAGQLDEVARHWPAARRKLVLLPLFDPQSEGALERYNIQDPFGGGRDRYERCYRRVEASIGMLLRHVTQPR